MRRVLVIMATCMMMIILACAKKNNEIESMISKAMEEYVEKHFANPKDYKEIAYIELKSTLDQRPPLESYLKERKTKDSIYNASAIRLSDLIVEFKTKYTELDELSESDQRIVKRILCDYGEWEESVYNQEKEKEECLKKVLSLLENYYPINIYEIGVRVKSKGELRIEEYCTWICDTTTAVRIYYEAVPSEDLPLKKTMLQDYLKLEECDDNRLKSYLIGEEIIGEIRAFNN